MEHCLYMKTHMPACYLMILSIPQVASQTDEWINMEHLGNDNDRRKTKLRNKPIPVQCSPLQGPCGLAWDCIWTSVDWSVTMTDTEHISPTVHIPFTVMILQLTSLPVAYGISCVIHCYCSTAHMVVSCKTKIVTWDVTLRCWASTSRHFEQL